MLGLLFLPATAWGQGTATRTIGLEIEVEPAFSVETQVETGNAKLGPLSPGGPAATSQVKVIIHTNRGQRYRVIHRMEGELVSDRGFDFPRKGIFYSASDGLNGGKSQVRSRQPLGLKPTPVFSSGRKGEADEFTLSYTAAADQVFPAGNYRARISIEGEVQ